MPFIGRLKSHFVEGRNEVILTAILAYACLRTDKTYEVPFGFISDCASIPRALWRLIGHPFDYRWREESILHDWFYRTTEHGVDRKTADLIFYDGLVYKGLGGIKARLMYLGVRLGARRAWRKNHGNQNYAIRRERGRLDVG